MEWTKLISDPTEAERKHDHSPQETYATYVRKYKKRKAPTETEEDKVPSSIINAINHPHTR
jgi:hypothetical protein